MRITKSMLGVQAPMESVALGNFKHQANQSKSECLKSSSATLRSIRLKTSLLSKMEGNLSSLRLAQVVIIHYFLLLEEEFTHSATVPMVS